MLQLRPNCEYCDKNLPPEATEARICTYECTFCEDCIDRVLLNVCPNCGGVCAAPDPTGDGAAAGCLFGQAAGVRETDPP